MRVIVCGSRDWSDQRIIWNVLSTMAEECEDLEIIHGGARGADTLAGQIAESFNLPVVSMPADWKTFGRAAGPMRNKDMLGKGPDLVIAFRNDGKSSGTDHMCQIARRAGVPVRVYDIRGECYDLPR